MSEEAVEQTDPVIDVDKLYDDAMAPEAPMENPTGDVVEPKKVDTSDAKEAERSFLDLDLDAEYGIKHDGKEQALTGKKFKDYAQKGFDYEQKMHGFKSEREQWESEKKNWETEREQFNQQTSEIQNYDKFLRENPAIFQEIQQKFNQYGGQQQNQQFVDNPNQLIAYPEQKSPEIAQLQQTVQSLQDRIAQEDQAKAQEAEQQKEKHLDTSINEYREKFDHFDWEKKDEFGYTLEQQVLNHALDKGLKDFNSAANDFLFDEHLKYAQMNASEKAAKKLQNQNKLGLGKISSTPMSKTASETPKGSDMSWAGGMKEIEAEYGIKF